MKNKGRAFDRVFITGGTGFIGTALVNHLREKNLQIKCLVNKSPLLINSPNIETVQGNLSGFNWNQLQDFNPGVIYHLARIPGTTKKERRQAATRNAQANKKLIDWLQEQDHPPLLVFISGTLVYGDQGDTWVDESVKVDPISFQREYFEAEKPILWALTESSLPVIIVRPPWIYGPGSWFEWFFWKHMQQKGKVPQYGHGQNLMSLIHIEDCAGLIHHVGKFGEQNQVYNITGHPPISQFQFTRLLQGLSGLSVKKYSRFRLWVQFEKAAREALTFSLKSTTRYKKLLVGYPFKYPELLPGLRSILNRLDEK